MAITYDDERIEFRKGEVASLILIIESEGISDCLWLLLGACGPRISHRVEVATYDGAVACQMEHSEMGIVEEVDDEFARARLLEVSPLAREIHTGMFWGIHEGA